VLVVRLSYHNKRLLTYLLTYAVATARAVAPLAYSAEESVLVARCTYVDREDDVVTQLVAVDTGSSRVIGFVGNGLVGVSFIAAEFIKNTRMLVVVYSSAIIEGTPMWVYTCSAQLLTAAA